ncbi:MAG: flavodoxin family protein [Proteobacteria bacterium]|nr:flavodoxin family protein [Pseudomonadota bacterium]
MNKFQWQDGLMEKIELLCAIFPSVIKNRWRDRLIYNSEKIAAYKGSSQVTEDIFWRSVYEVFPGGYEPLILKIKDPEKLKADMLQSRNQENLEPGTEPVQLTRWAGDSPASAAIPQGKKILAVNSCLRKGGNTDVMIDELARACRDNGSAVEKLYLGDLNIKPCTGCRACRKADVKTICTVKDDMTEFMYGKLYEMDGLIFGFPIYTARENGIMANFMDRWDCLSNPYLTRKMPGLKKALVVCSWMWPNPVAYDTIVEQMIILLRLHSVETTDVLVVSGTRGKKHGRGVVKNHPEILNPIYQAGIDFLRAP